MHAIHIENRASLIIICFVDTRGPKTKRIFPPFRAAGPLALISHSRGKRSWTTTACPSPMPDRHTATTLCLSCTEAALASATLGNVLRLKMVVPSRDHAGCGVVAVQIRGADNTETTHPQSLRDGSPSESCPQFGSTGDRCGICRVAEPDCWR